MSTIFEYEYHGEVSTHHEMMNKFQTFMDLQTNWNVIEWSDNVSWIGGGTGFTAGNESFLMIENIGLGANQNKEWRFRQRQTGSDPLSETIEMTHTLKSGEGSYSNSNSTHPVQQDNIEGQDTEQEKMSWLPTDIPEVYFFASDLFAACFARFDSNFCGLFFIGSINLFSQTFDGGTICGNYQLDTNLREWYDYTGSTLRFACCFNRSKIEGHESMTTNNAFSNNWRTNVNFAYNAYTTNTAFGKSRMLLYNNGFSGIRAMIPMLFFLDEGSGGVPVGESECFICRCAGTPFGERVTRGSETYLTFWDCYSSANHGIAFRIT